MLLRQCENLNPIVQQSHRKLARLCLERVGDGQGNCWSLLAVSLTKNQIGRLQKRSVHLSPQGSRTEEGRGQPAPTVASEKAHTHIAKHKCTVTVSLKKPSLLSPVLSSLPTVYLKSVARHGNTTYKLEHVLPLKDLR